MKAKKKIQSEVIQYLHFIISVKVTAMMQKVRTGCDESQLYVFDVEHEQKRRRQLERLFNRSKEQLDEELYLLDELRKIEARKKERERKQQDVNKLLTAVIDLEKANKLAETRSLLNASLTGLASTSSSSASAAAAAASVAFKQRIKQRKQQQQTLNKPASSASSADAQRQGNANVSSSSAVGSATPSQSTSLNNSLENAATASTSSATAATTNLSPAEQRDTRSSANKKSLIFKVCDFVHLRHHHTIIS